MFSSPVNNALSSTTHTFGNSDKPRSHETSTHVSKGVDHEKKLSEPPSPRPVVTTRPTGRMTSAAMEDTLKARNISIHAAHVFYIGIPSIMALATAYATDRISRKGFIEALNLFVQHACAVRNTPRALTPAHLVSLGIPERDAERLPLVQTSRDLWIVAGLLNCVMETEDFDQLQNPDKKGQFWEKNFGNSKTRQGGYMPPRLDDDDAFISWQVLPYVGKFHVGDTEFEIKPTCEVLEKGAPRYNATVHYLLRLEAARRKGLPICLLGPYSNEEEMKKMFYSIFRIVDPDYPGTTLAGLDAFTFSEPPPSPPPPMPAPKQTTSSKSTTIDCRSRPFCTLV
jgi:hypothetical protein